MLGGVLAGLGVALLLDARLRRRREEWKTGERHGGGPPVAEAPAQLPGPVPAPRDADAEPDLSDEELVARVLALADVPRGVEVTAVEGAVVLFGRIPRFAFAALLSRVARVPGVVDIEDRLTPVDGLGMHEPP